MAQTVFSEALRNFFPSSSQPFSGTSAKPASFLIDNLLGKAQDKDHHKSTNSAYSPTFPHSVPVNDVRFFGLPRPHMDAHSDGSRLLSSFANPFFPGSCMPFLPAPAAMHDLRNYMNGIRMDSQNFPPYGEYALCSRSLQLLASMVQIAYIFSNVFGIFLKSIECDEISRKIKIWRCFALVYTNVLRCGFFMFPAHRSLEKLNPLKFVCFGRQAKVTRRILSPANQRCVVPWNHILFWRLRDIVCQKTCG